MDTYGNSNKTIPCEAHVKHMETCNDYYVGWRLAPVEVRSVKEDRSNTVFF